MKTPEIKFSIIAYRHKMPKPTYVLDDLKLNRRWFWDEFSLSPKFSLWVQLDGKRTLISSYQDWLDFCNEHQEKCR
jgi:hypothetical protein